MSSDYKRRPITIQADVIRDRDLLRWYNGIQSGDKQTRLKRVIRLGIEAERRDQDALTRVHNIEAALDEMAQNIALLMNKPSGIDAAALENLVSRFGSMATEVQAFETYNEPDPIARLSEDEIEERTAARKGLARKNGFKR